jgi:fumarate hydratase, class II
MTESDERIERDSMGEVRVPARSEVARADPARRRELPDLRARLERAQIEALARIKAAVASVKRELDMIDGRLADAIIGAAEEVARGEHDDQFPIDVFQTGSGTSSNMNMNEVLATLATSASGGRCTRTTTSTTRSRRTTCSPRRSTSRRPRRSVRDLVPALEHLAASLERKARRVRRRREVGAHPPHGRDAGDPRPGVRRLRDAGADRRRAAAATPAAGRRAAARGTAVGTGINSPPGFGGRVIEEIASATGLPLTEARDHFEAQGARDGLVELSGQLRTIAVSLTRSRTTCAGWARGRAPASAEINLPDLQPGSSIMPGKVNPVLPEATLMVCAQVIGNDAAVAWGGAAGNFELNVMLPMLGRNLLESIRLLANVTRLLADRCVDGITANVERLREYAESSPAIVTPLNRYLGYEEAAAIAKQALAERRTIREVVIARGHVEAGRISEEQLDEALDVMRMTRP